MAYHGTLAGDKILLDGALVPTNEENSVYGLSDENELSLKTSAGYVYLALEIEKAYEFALVSILKKGLTFQKTSIYIFEVDTTGIEIYPDYDELGRFEENLRVAITETKTYAVKEELLLGKHVLRYRKIDVTNYNEGCEITNAGKINEYPWIDLVRSSPD
ncbi:hypothetical protein [Paenibacillus silviterrae]|uniref:hypothetical protein n=1 Tax=Paenibacillus silviterrae TaxID=3242194 RepID=UPI0025434160|nr:hypothetical protein [Paenibacillus chinjuensis]